MFCPVEIALLLSEKVTEGNQCCFCNYRGFLVEVVRLSCLNREYVNIILQKVFANTYSTSLII